MIPGAAVVALLACQRLLEMAVSRRNLAAALARGGSEHHPESFRLIALLHLCFLLSLLAESGGREIPFDPPRVLLLAALLLLQGVRYWCMATLGACWNTRIVTVPGERRIVGGPYRFLRHPNYLVVLLEFVLIPLFLQAPLTLLFFPVNLLLLRRRVLLEEGALRGAAPQT